MLQIASAQIRTRACFFLGVLIKTCWTSFRKSSWVNAPDAKALYGCEVPEGLRVKNLARDYSVGAIIIRIGFGCVYIL